MIVDAHIHAFPPLDGPSGYPSAAHHAMMLQNKVAGYWGRMVTNTLDEARKPLPHEEVDFRIGKYGRYYWRKGGQECWMQRFPLAMADMEWPPERMVAYMDAVGVDVGVLQSGYMEMNFCRDYFAQCVERWPDRFVSTVAIDFDLRKDLKYRESELAKIRYAVSSQHAKGVFQGFPKGQPFDDEQFAPLWRTLSDLHLPHIFLTGWEPKASFLATIKRLENVQKQFPDLKMVLGHLGGNVLPPSDPNHTDTVKVLRNVLRGPNVYFEAGYVMAFENKEIWGADYEYPYPQHARLLKEVYEDVGAGRLIWGSDEPNNERACTYIQCLESVRTHCAFLNEEEKKQVLGLNAARLYRIPIRNHSTESET